MQAVKNERGSVLIFVTLMIVLLLVMVGLGLDTGQLTYARNQGQAAVDAAALAAVSALPSRNDTLVKDRAAAFNSKNTYVGSGTNTIGTDDVSYVNYNFATGSITYNEPIATANGVRVALESGSSINSPTFLTPLFNLMGISMTKTKNVTVSAVSVITARPAIPIALWQSRCGGDDNPLLTKVKIEMQHPDQSDSAENACWTTFFDCSSGAPDIKAGFEVASTCNGNNIVGTIGIGSMICQNKGQVNTVMQAADDFFMDKALQGRWWIIPVVKGTGNCATKDPTAIVDFAKIQVTDIVKTGSPKYIEANIQCGQSLQSTEESLCFTHRLVREKAKNM